MNKSFGITGLFFVLFFNYAYAASDCHKLIQESLLTNAKIPTQRQAISDHMSAVNNMRKRLIPLTPVAQYLDVCLESGFVCN